MVVERSRSAEIGEFGLLRPRDHFGNDSKDPGGPFDELSAVLRIASRRRCYGSPLSNADAIHDLPVPSEDFQRGCDALLIETSGSVDSRSKRRHFYFT